VGLAADLVLLEADSVLLVLGSLLWFELVGLDDLCWLVLLHLLGLVHLLLNRLLVARRPEI